MRRRVVPPEGERNVMKILAGIAAAVVAVLVIGFVVRISVRNGLIEKDESVRSAWSEIDTQLQRRADLIPNLVNTVKGYAAHEADIFTRIAEARSRLLDATAMGPEATAKASGEMTGLLGRLLAIAENYPNLKADTTFVRLQDELAGTENRIGVARTRYNTAVKSFNAAIRKFPGSLFAAGLDLTAAEYFEPPAGSAAVQTPPSVSFE